MTYFSNGSEGMKLDNQCEDCVLGGSACTVYEMQFEFNYEQVGNELATKIMDHFIKDGVCQLKIVMDNESVHIKQTKETP